MVLLSTEATGGEQPDIFTYDPMVPVVSLGGHSCCFPFAAPMGPADQGSTEQLNSVLVYTTAPFDEEVLVIGSATLVLFAATDALDTDWTARLCLVDESGNSRNLIEGIVRARFRDSFSQPTLLEPNRAYRYEIDLGALAQLVKPGERLRLIVASSDFPQWDRNLNTGGDFGREGLVEACVATQVVLHDPVHPSHLRLSTLRDDG